MPPGEEEIVTTPVDRSIAALAARQYGLVTRAQLREMGLGDSAIGKRAEAGRLHRVHHGVYAVGHRVLPARGTWMAATLACGRGAVLSHTSAAALWELRSSDAEVVHVTVPTAGGRRRRGLRIHRDPRLAPVEVTARHGIPVTTVSRTLLDIAGTLPPRRLQRAIDQAEVERLLDLASLDAVIARHAGHHRAAKLSAALRAHRPGTTLTRSELEERFLGLCADLGLPRPQVNRTIAGLEVDFVFEPDRVVVETDGWRFHGTRAAFERDRRRDATLTRAGYRTLRFTHRQIEGDARTVAATVAAALLPTAASRTAGTRSAR
jgi:very-short-patch-repair endonuclease/predicted transcriptional regulator of viral defense system